MTYKADAVFRPAVCLRAACIRGARVSFWGAVWKTLDRVKNNTKRRRICLTPSLMVVRQL